MDENEATTKPMIETVIEMLKSLQAQVSVMANDMAEIKAEQSRQARQLDAIAKDMYKSAGDIYELRLDFREFRETTLGSLPQIGK